MIPTWALTTTIDPSAAMGKLTYQKHQRKYKEHCQKKHLKYQIHILIKKNINDLLSFLSAFCIKMEQEKMVIF